LPVVARTTMLASKLVATDAVLAIRPASLVRAAALGLGATAVAAILPARRAARVPVVETLTRRGPASPRGGGRSGPWAAAALALAGLAVLVHLRAGDPATGLAASALLVLATAAGARPVFERLAPAGARLLETIAGPTGRLAAATLLRDPARTALSISTIAVGFGTVLWMWTLARSFEHSVVEVMPGKLRGDLSVGSAHLDAGFVEAPLDESIVEEVRAIPGVAAVVGERAVDSEYAGGPIAIDAFDPEYFTDPRFGRLPLVGRSLPDALGMVARGEAVVVSENFVHNLGLGPGDLVALDAPAGPLRLRIAGVTPDFLSPRGTIEMSRRLFREWWHDDAVVHALVKVAPGVPVAQVREDVARSLGDRFGLRVLSLGALVDWFAEQVRRAFSALHVLSGLVLLVVLVGVGDALAATNLERVREFGIVRAIGLRGSTLAASVAREALAMCALGLVLACALGAALGALWVKATFPALVGWTLRLHLPLPEAAMVAASAVAACLLASWLPARRASRLDPAEALRME
ncbi:MAG: ABC transporter permease, partial [Alphaproteobacteria bacterium]